MTETLSFDADAARAARLEAEGPSFAFTFNGDPFTLPPAKMWPLTVVGLLSEGNIAKAMEDLLGDQWPAFVAGRPTLADVEAIFAAVSEWQGTTLGE